MRIRTALEIKQFYQVFTFYAGIKKILFTLKNPFFVAPASGIARYRDPIFRPFVRRPSVNICDHPSVDPIVQARNSEPYEILLQNLVQI